MAERIYKLTHYIACTHCFDARLMTKNENNFSASILVVTNHYIPLHFFTLAILQEIKKDIMYLSYSIMVCWQR